MTDDVSLSRTEPALELFTAKQLPPGIVLLVKKMKDGKEWAIAVDRDCEDEVLVHMFRFLAKAEPGHG